MEPRPLSRVFHIDALRGVAILMMLQGHFVDTLLIDAARVGNVHAFWKFWRGLTAPVFFTTSGVIVVYLLVRKSDLKYRKMRLKKAFWRALEVIMWGYILRFNIWPYFFEGKFYPEFWKVDVLHTIGMGLLLLSFVYILSFFGKKGVLQVALFCVSMLIFSLEPYMEAYDFSNWPPAIRNYFTTDYGSVFQVSPFLGYLLFGGFIGSMYTVLYENNKILFLVGLLLLGTFLTHFSSMAFIRVYDATNIQLFKELAWFNNGFSKLGNVLYVYAVFVALEPFLAKMKVLNEIGQNTLTVYIMHFFLLYGSVLGLGIDDILFDKRSLPPEAVIPGALIFVVVVSWLTLRYHRWKETW